MVVLFSSCGGGERHFAILDEIDSLCDSDPRAAMSRLDSIDCGSLSEKERHYHDLLSIKSHDKAYVRHTSDSLILDVIDYYSSHKNDAHYPEALYYGGRVYSDIGDLPTALSYLQNAIENNPDNKRSLNFKRNVLNQTGRLLYALRLDSAAIDYFEKSLIIDDKLKDNDNRIVFTYKFLGNAYLNIHDIENSRRYIDKALKYIPHLSNTHKSNILIDFAGILAREGKIDSALLVIKSIHTAVDTLAYSKYLALASQIYCEEGISDTAYMYARQLTRQNDPSNKRTGYKVIFSENLRNHVPKDTLIALISEYKCCIEEFLNNHEGENAIIQNSQYNYSIHEKERVKAEKRLYIYILIASVAVIVSLILLVVVFYLKFKNADTKANYVTAINLLKESTGNSYDKNGITEKNSDISILEKLQDKQEGMLNMDVNPNEFFACNTIYEHEKLADIKKRLMSGIKAAEDKDINTMVNPAILASPVYCNLIEKIKTENCIPLSEEKLIYKSLEELIGSVSQGFFFRLRILTEDRITPSEMKVAMLIKCGFSPLQISILLGKEKNTISTHRRNLAFKITGLKKADRTLDFIIISL